MGGHVFISYSRADGDYVRELAAHLGRAGVPVWYDHEIVAGDRWEQVIRDKVATCAAFVVVMTPAAEESRWVNREINHAEKTGRPVFPLLLDGDEFFRLNDVQFTDVSDGRMPTDHFVTRLAGTTTAEEAEEAQDEEDIPDGSDFVAWSPDGERLAIAGSEKGARLWDPAIGTTRAGFGTPLELMGLSWAPDGRSLALLSRFLVWIWARDTAGPRTGIPHDGAVRSVAWSPDSRRLAIAYHFGLRIWDLSLQAVVRDLDVGPTEVPLWMAWSPTGDRLITQGSEAGQVWDPVTGARLLTLQSWSDAKACSTLTADGRHLAIGGKDGRIRVWDVMAGTGPWFPHISPRATGVTRVAWGPDGRLAAAAEHVIGADKIHVWDLPGDRKLVAARAMAGVTALSWSPVGSTLAIATTGQDVELWDPATGDSRLLTGDGDQVSDLSWSPDGRYLATGSADHPARIWPISAPGEPVAAGGTGRA